MAAMSMRISPGRSKVPIGVSLLLVVSNACASAVRSPYLAGCPEAETTPGYPVVATTSAGANVAESWLHDVARAAAYRWAVPSRTGELDGPWRSVLRRVLPPEPRWADDWRPDSLHRAAMAFTIYDHGGASAPDVQRASGDPLFDQSLPTIVDDPLPSSPSFPPPPATAGDSVRVVLTFGEEPTGAGAVIRFAAQQTPVKTRAAERRKVPFLAGPLGPPSRLAVRYDVNADGRLVAGSFEVLDGSGISLARSLEQTLARQRFTPAESNCRPITMTVLQIIGQ